MIRTTGSALGAAFMSMRSQLDAPDPSMITIMCRSPTLNPTAHEDRTMITPTLIITLTLTMAPAGGSNGEFNVFESNLGTFTAPRTQSTAPLLQSVKD